MLKPFAELSRLDVRPYCSLRDAKDERGNPIKVPYLSWAKCAQLLHENGAESVFYTPVPCPGTGTYLWPQMRVETSKGRVTECWFVRVEIHIDDLVFPYDMPLLNGTLVVYEDTLNQLRINNALARAFVKGVAIRTGLGFALWADGDGDDGEDDLSRHNIYAVKERLERLITAKEQRGMSHRDLLAALNISDKQLATMMGWFDRLDHLERAVGKL
jgi:hypothetical protein